MKATWTRTVITKAGETKKDTFNSVYQPPALFHKKESFVTAPSNGSPTPTPFVGATPTPTVSAELTPSATPAPTNAIPVTPPLEIN